MTTVLLLDDHPLIVSGIAQYLQDKDTINVVGKAYSLAETTRLLQKQQVDVLVSDMHLDGERSGIDLLVHIKKNYPATKLIFYTMIEKSNEVREAVLAGAEGYVLKKYDADEVYRAIRTVQANKTYYSPELVQILVRMPTSTTQKDEQPEALKSLTPRELEVMKLIAYDIPIGKIAEQLSLSESTINSHRTNLMQKLGVRSSVGITHFAFKYGLIDRNLL
ncbi:response regulator [Spirosoma validum]|uniref:Response regulator transcription factor n=1 Tax=Spirosoma validum TaxID=2771355 RepID=A0A927AXX3_9BACT|nr:response regulator transcription factor [Spirosoma validum]MBD2751850.1 response regulator transcription factor [Spirosoma validum]